MCPFQCLDSLATTLKGTKMHTNGQRWIIDDPAHSLIPNFAEAFIPLIQDKYDIRENLWEIEAYCKSTSDGLKEYFSFIVDLAWYQLQQSCSKCVLYG